MKNIRKVAQYITQLLKQTINNQKGVVLPIILMAIGGLSLIGAAAVSVSSGEMNIAHNDRNYKVAFNLAEAGISDAADGVAGNRDLLPVPLGVITSASYSFNVGGTAFNDTGRYNVTVEIPVVTAVKTQALIGASSVEVWNTKGLNQGTSIIIGDATTHLMATIGSITPTTGTSGILNLVDGRNNPYVLGVNINADTMFVAKNWVRITSTGEAGSGLGSNYTAVALWRASSSINANPNMTPPAAGIGAIRSRTTLQAEYSIQEINIMNSLQGDANPVPAAPQTFNGPILVTGSLTGPNPYNKNDYSGPIFAPTDKITGGQIKFDGTSYNPITNGVNAKYPKIIPISTAAATKANVNNILAQADVNATCYQLECSNASASQQIYNINGYKLQVKVFKPQKGGGLQLAINDDSTNLGANGDVTMDFEIVQSFSLTSSDDVPLVFTDAAGTPPVPSTNTTLSVSNATITKQGNVTDTGSISMIAGKVRFKGSGAGTGLSYSAGTIITVTIPQSEMTKLGSGVYVWLYDNSNNIPGFGGGKSYSNGVYMTSLGNLQSEQWQGDIVYQNDAATHTHLTPTIQTTAPTIYVRGLYAATDTTLAPWTTTAQTATGDMGAVLFGGRKATDTNWVPGDQAEYLLTYYIHTTAIGNCNAHDIKVTSYSKVTYIGDSSKCNDTEIRRVFVYETIWNHLSDNNLSKGLQPDDTDPKLVMPNPHKGYYKYDGGKDKTDNELIIIGKSRAIVMGDDEFNSVFNHAAKPDYHSAIVNMNISQINMIGAANPPTTYLSGQMTIAPVPFASTSWIPTSTKNWDVTEMIGNRSGFIATHDTNGFDFVDFSIASGSVTPYNQNGMVLPDVSGTPGAGGTTGFTLYKATSTPAEIKSVRTVGGVYTTVSGTTWGSPTIAAFPNNGTPIMNPNQMGSTIITATISGPWFSSFNVRRGSVNLVFDPANGIPFNIQTLSVETKGSGSSITMGSSANPVAVYANSFTLKSEDCGGQTNFSFTGKMIASSVQFEGNVKYVVDTTITNAPGCLAPSINSLIYLKKTNWQEIRN